MLGILGGRHPGGLVFRGHGHTCFWLLPLSSAPWSTPCTQAGALSFCYSGVNCFVWLLPAGWWLSETMSQNKSVISKKGPSGFFCFFFFFFFFFFLLLFHFYFHYHKKKKKKKKKKRKKSCPHLSPWAYVSILITEVLEWMQCQYLVTHAQSASHLSSPFNFRGLWLWKRTIP